TRWPRDWSSDVCSSDLSQALLQVHLLRVRERPLVDRLLERVLLPRGVPRHDGSGQRRAGEGGGGIGEQFAAVGVRAGHGEPPERSEERRVGKEGRGGGW